MDTVIKYEFFMALAHISGVLGLMNLIANPGAYGVIVLCIGIMCHLIASQWKQQARLIKCIKRAGVNASKMMDHGVSEDQAKRIYIEELEVLLEREGYENPGAMARELVNKSDDLM